jgi:tyrosyl-tRNA synthetase
MDLEERLRIVGEIGEEIITPTELRELFEREKHPTAYDGFEPSGIAPLHFGVYRALNLKELLKTGIRFRLFLADWHAWVNNKMGGELEKIRKTGEYFVEVWKAAGVDMDKVEIVWASDLLAETDYWKKVILVAKNTSVKRATRALTIMGRKEGEMNEVAQYFYPMMQVADIFQLDVDICQLGLDQRRANILAREIAPKLGWKKPVLVHHHMLMGLEGVKKPDGFEDETTRDVEISSKMSKSRPESCIYVHDSKKEIEKKINKAYCRPKEVGNNPILEYCKYIIFKEFGEMRVSRPKKFGGDIIFQSYHELENAFRKGDLHPADLKKATAFYLEKLIKPVREHFQKGVAKKLWDFVRKQDITR